VRELRTPSVEMTGRTGPIPALEGNPVGTTLDFAAAQVNVQPAFTEGGTRGAAPARIRQG
jgi:hypothetical protein